MTEEDKRSAGNPTAREEDEDQALNLPDEEEDQPSMEEIEHLMKQTGKINGINGGHSHMSHNIQ